MISILDSIISYKSCQINGYYKFINKFHIEGNNMSSKTFRIPKDFHGIPTFHSGKDFTSKEMESLDSAVGNMRDQYPGIHDLLGSLSVYNGPLIKSSTEGLHDIWGSLPQLWSATIGGLTSVSPMTDGEGNPLLSHMLLNSTLRRAANKMPLSPKGTTGNGGKLFGGADALGRTYTHEFGHVMQYGHSLASKGWIDLARDRTSNASDILSSIDRIEGFSTPTHLHDLTADNVSPLQKSAIAAFRESNATLNQPFIDAMAKTTSGGMTGIEAVKGSGELNPKATEAMLGSKYAGTGGVGIQGLGFPELGPELNVQGNYPNKYWNPGLEAAARKNDETLRPISHPDEGTFSSSYTGSMGSSGGGSSGGGHGGGIPPRELSGEAEGVDREARNLFRGRGRILAGVGIAGTVTGGIVHHQHEKHKRQRAQGARPKSRSAIGGIGYLQSR